MNATRWTFVVLAAVALALGLGGVAYAYHSGGVAECTGCHSMHSPKDAALGFLLVAADQSSTCLTCHENNADTGPSSYHISTSANYLWNNGSGGVAPLQRTPGGDFGWIRKSYTFVLRGNTITEDGATHGHNIVASDFGYVADPHNAQSPGGTYPSAQLACVSCHDPHGKARRKADNTIVVSGQAIKGSGSYYNNTSVAANEPDANNAVGVYRLLAHKDYVRQAPAPSASFPGVPAAKVPSTYNRTEQTTQTRTAYGKVNTTGHTTWGQWCATCHEAMHSDNGYVHPIDTNLDSNAAIYNAYVNSSNTSGGNQATAFTSLVPFVSTGKTYAELALLAVNNNTQLGGPVASDQVSCVSCHRAHASGWPFGLRWNMEYEFITKGPDAGGVAQYCPQSDTSCARGRTPTETAAAYYDRPASVFGNYQRVLCNKCHAKD